MTDDNTTTTSEGGIGLHDILYVLFRRKWMILSFIGLGLVLAAGVFLRGKPVYQSEAKLLLRYVQENRAATAVDKDSQIRAPDSTGDALINAELEILSSFDLATQVAEIIGPEKIQGTAGKETNAMEAAIMIQKGLQVDAPRKSSIIRLIYTHGDPEVTQGVLRQLIASYLKKHVELHRGVGDLDKFLAQQTDQLRSRLSQTDDTLQKIKQKSGIISPEETKKAYVEMISKIRQELFDVEAEIAERKAALAEIGPGGDDAQVDGLPADKVEEYKLISGELSRAQMTRREMIFKYTAESPVLQQFLERMARTEQEKKKLEQEFPKLKSIGVTVFSGAGTNQFDVATESTRVKALEARAKVLKTQLDIVKTEATGLEQAEAEIAELMRQRAVEEAHFLSYSKSLEQARIQENLGAGKITNIGEVQAPSFPTRSRKATKKLMVQVAGASTALGIALAFGLGLFLDQSVRRPQEIESKLKLPLFFALPRLSKGERKLLKNGSQESTASGGGDPQLWNGTGSLRPYFEAMRDRLLHYFEARNLTHKPKLVAVTGCGSGAGVSSIAKGLALSLSEAGDGNILLVDMSSEQGAAHLFTKMDSCPGLPEALEEQTRGAGQVHDKLYLATANEFKDGVDKVIPRRFNHLVPKMKASDYDFIIFDLPPVSATSITPRLAKFMDLVLEVVEAEKTNRDTVKRAAAVLSEGQPNVSVVVNKCQKHLPNWFHQEF
jgi:polysaccharide biosynthesis transport protein